MLSLLAIALASYAIGSIPTALWLGRLLRGIDIREHGSGNPGATNAARVLGRATGLAVLVIDVGKGFLAVWLVSRIRLGPAPWDDTELRLLAALSAVAGHLWSAFARFRGGKGVATAGGAFLAVHPGATGLSLLVFATVAASTRIVSLSSLAAAATLPLALWLLRVAAGIDIGAASILTAALVGVLIAWAHRSNIRRLLEGAEEPGL